MPPLELESNVSLWLSAVSQYKARVTFCSYSVMEMCTKGLGAQTGVLRVSVRPRLLSCQNAQTRGSYLVLNQSPGTPGPLSQLPPSCELLSVSLKVPPFLCTPHTAEEGVRPRQGCRDQSAGGQGCQGGERGLY